MIFRAASWMRAKLRAQRPAPRLVLQPGPRLPVCRNCIHFRNDPADIAAALPGIASFDAGQAAMRADDGLCLCHDRFVTLQSSCAKFRDRFAKFRMKDHKPNRF